MNHYFTKSLTITYMVLVSIILINCSAANSDNNTSATTVTPTTNSSTNANNTGSVNGTRGFLTAADGSPIEGATIVISSNQQAQNLQTLIKNDAGHMLNLPHLIDERGNECADLSNMTGTVYAQGCSGPDGSYETELITASLEIPCGTELTFTAVKGSFSLSLKITLTCSGTDGDVIVQDDTVFDDNCGTDRIIPTQNLTAGAPIAYVNVDRDSCDFDIAKMAVVTGYWDRIQDVIAKLGFGSVTAGGRLDLNEDFDFTLIDGDESLPDSRYENFSDWIRDYENLSEYDIIFINCGNADYAALADDPTVVNNLRRYVASGGKLYITDRSYPFIEQAFPSFMNFYGGGNDANVAESPIDIAYVGDSDITSNATVNNSKLAAWLDNVSVNRGDIETDCFNIGASDVNDSLGARRADGKVKIGDFLSGWAYMSAPHINTNNMTTVWIQGPITYDFGISDEAAPLTATMDYEEGRILYSSYHTADSCPTTGFWPQERILQYLVFEL